MNKDHCIINIRSLLPELEKKIVREAQTIIEYHQKEVVALPEGFGAPQSIMYLALKRVAEQYKPKMKQGGLIG
jgi:hypothetical protein